MIEAILIIVIIALVGLIVWDKREHRLIQNKLLNAILAKSPQDQVNLDLADKTQVKVEQPKQPDFTSSDNLSQEDWERLIKN